ncbi:MAG: c-type cytochrome [Tepidisphaera sp.]
MQIQVSSPSRTRRSFTHAKEAAWLMVFATGLAAAFGLRPVPSTEFPLLVAEQRPAPAASTQAAAPTAAGWSMTVTSADGKTTARSHSNFPSFALAKGGSLDFGVAAADQKVVFEGTLTVDKTGPHRWAMDVEGGRATIRVSGGGKQVATASGTGVAARGEPGGVLTNWADITPGEYSVVIEFVRTGDGPARLRTVWEKQWLSELRAGLDQGFLAEPIPTAMVRTSGTVADQTRLSRHGRVLLGEYGCFNCHDGGDAGPTAVDSRKAPLLGEIARRANPDWLVKWIANPGQVKPHTRMPDVIGDGLNEPNVAVNITHFIMSFNGGDPGPAETLATEPEGFARGRELYHTLGCVACHGAYESPRAVFGETSQPDTVPSMDKVHSPHGKLSGKWRPEALREFLLDPLRSHPSGRMPNMKLSEEEADLITRYLITKWDEGNKPKPTGTFKVDPGRAALGNAAYATKGCAACHEVGGGRVEIASMVEARPLSDMMPGRGCMDPADTGSPRFAFRDGDIAALTAGIESLKVATGVPAPIEHELQTMDALNCRACHAKDGSGGVPREFDPYFRSASEKTELGDEGRLPPQLTLVGWKLTSNWTRQVLMEAARARPYMLSRMPQFGKDNVEGLVHGMASHDGEWPDTDAPEPKSSDELVAAGRRLIGDQGLNCISCHVWGDLPPAGTAGPSITEFAARLRYDWWRSYILQPKRFKPGTRMSEFYLTGKSSAVDVLKGDAYKQPEAMWAYFQTGEFGPAPSGVGASGDSVKLTPDGKPIVFRSFLQHAGSRGIAVGFPAGTHFAYDATKVRLVEAWKGDFLDATGAWKSRGGSITGGQGKLIWSAPKGPAIVVGSEAPATWPEAGGGEAGLTFGGYLLDEAGVPTFRSTMKSGDLTLSITERVTPGPAGEAAFTRVIGVSGAKGKAFWINAGVGTIIPTCRTPIQTKTVDGQTWIRVLSFEDQVEVTMAVTP